MLQAMGEWAVRWVFGDPRPEELDPSFLMWWMHRRVNFDALPPGRTVVRFDLVSPGRSVHWLVLEPGDASVCTTDPGLDVAVQVTADMVTFHRVFAGRIGFGEALADGSIEVVGPSGLVRQLPDWFAWSPFSEAMRSELATR